MRTRSISSVVVAVAGVACVLAPSLAHADGYGLQGTLWVEAAGSYLPNASGNAPTFSLTDISTSARTIVGTTRPAGIGMGFFGLRAGLGFVAGDRWIIPVLDLGIYGAVGVYSDWLTSADGSLVRFHPAGALRLDAQILGIGLRFKKRRWMFEGALTPGVALLAMPTSVADGKEFTDAGAQIAPTFTLRASLSVCRRIDPMERVCASVTPNIYQFGFGNGGSVSLRWELGP